MAIKGVVESYRDKGNHVITCVTEHKAVLDCCKSLEKQGCQVTYLPVDRNGLVSMDRLREAITDKTILISIMAANNEIGTIEPVKEIGQLAHEKGILFHTDATQAVGKIPVNVEAMGIDLLSLTAHKMYGPKGIGALYVRAAKPRVRLKPMIDGGGHERGMRSGTLNVPGIVGLGKACEIAQKEMAGEAERLTSLRERLKNKIIDQLDEVLCQRSSDGAAAGQHEYELRLCRGRVPLDGLKRDRGFNRLGLHLCELGAFSCLAGHWCRGGAGSHCYSFWFGPFQH